ncbi:MAG: hypothetical protein J5982_01625 [Bacilli bacterium]|nr:hypothetical protein [Bacilli bacterium]
MNSNEMDKNKINRVATPIKIDSTGNPIVNRENKEIVIVKKEKKTGSMTSVLVVILLLILALIAFLLFYIIIPEYLEESERSYEVNPTTTMPNTKENYPITSGLISDNSLVNTPGDYIINEEFKLSLVNTGTGISVIVNGSFIDSSSYISNRFALLDDLIMINLIGNNNRTSKLYAVDLKGNIVYTLYNLTEDGMLLNGDADVQYSTASFIVSSSRVSGNNIILNNEFGNINGLNICNYELLGEHNINESFSAISYYSLEYLGNHKFSKPTLISSISLGEYRSTSNLCNE